MRFFSQKCLENRMDVAHTVFDHASKIIWHKPCKTKRELPKGAEVLDKGVRIVFA
jgi:hypothetical protein